MDNEKIADIFEVTSGKLRVTDPCYDNDSDIVPSTHCAVTLTDVKNGEWVSCVEWVGCESWGDRVSGIIVRHKSAPKIEYLDGWTAAPFRIPVDSGQAGFFDYDPWLENRGGEFDEHDTFYGKCCELTLSEECGGIVDVGGKRIGAVSSSGYGDGEYVCSYIERNGEIIAAKIVFILDREEENDGDFDES